MAQAAGVELIEDQSTVQLDRQLELLMTLESVHDPNCILCNPRPRQAAPVKDLSLNRKLRSIVYPREKR